MDSVIEKPLSVHMFGSDMKLNVVAAGTTSVTTLENQAHWFLGAELGLLLSERLALGAAFQSLRSEYYRGDSPIRHRIPACAEGAGEPGQESQECLEAIDMFDAEDIFLATATMEYVWWSQNRLSASTQLHLGLGVIQGQDLFNPLPVSELRTHVFYDIHPWLQAGMGLGYRAAREVALDRQEFWGRSLNGLSGNVMIRLTLF